MIVGDPLFFALQFDVVDSWNSSDGFWKNGVFSLYINGERVFGVLDVFELRTILSFYSKLPMDDLRVNDLVVSGKDVYENADSYFLGDGTVLMDGVLDLTCTPMGDSDCYLYFVRMRARDRLVWSVDGGINISEFFLEAGFMSKFLKSLNACSL